MTENSILQERLFLSLLKLSNKESLALELLKSPLGLSIKILDSIFSDELEKLQQNLDEIKGFTAGVTSAENKSNDYKIASYYKYLFSFHQFVHSSFRARQGKVLEVIVDLILKNYCNCEIQKTPNKKLKRLSEIIKKNIPKHDIDSFGLLKEKNKIIIIQIRSRDDTGGLTAKGSLVELFNEIVKLKIEFKYEITYLIVVWVPLDSQQKNSTINKFYTSISNVVDVNKTKFKKEISDGIEIMNNLFLKFDYGLDELSQSLKEWSGITTDLKEKFDEIIYQIENWDDLWISYAIASLEIEIKSLRGMNNVEILRNKLKENKFRLNFSSYEKLVNSIEDITNQLIPLWTEELLPVSSPADQLLYIRDLLYLYACYRSEKRRKRR